MVSYGTHHVVWDVNMSNEVDQRLQPVLWTSNRRIRLVGEYDPARRAQSSFALVFSQTVGHGGARPVVFRFNTST